MADPFVAEVRMFGFNFAPTGWATCDGQILPISQNTALFSLLGTTYGGNGQSTFALPNLQGSAALHPGQGQGLSQYFLGQEGGEQTVTLLVTEIPVHTHLPVNCKAAGGLPTPTANMWGTASAAKVAANFYAPAAGSSPIMNPAASGLTGGGQPHNNMMPYLTLTFCIALQGVYPPRT
ncbi:MAG TPA: tail fiber protein [Ferruginibacter sp.]|nr:tail fiber protein [Ferruginibacter sp.]